MPTHARNVVSDFGRGRNLAAGALIAVVLVLGCGVSGCRSLDRPADRRPDAARALVLVEAAEDAVREGDRDRALREFIRAIEANPRLTRAHFGVADLYREGGDYSRAAEGYGRAAEIEPRNFEAQYYHGLMLQLIDRVAEAIQAYLRALSIRPDDFQTTLNLAAAYYQLDENVQALPYAREAVRLDPGSGEARFNLAATYAALGRHREAVAEYQQATELMELTPELLMNLAESLGRIDRYEEMRNTLLSLLEIDESPAAHERVGFAEFRLGRYEEALGRFRRALELDPDYYPALNGVGVSMLNRWIWSDRRDMESKEEGLRALRRSLQINRNQSRIRELLSRYGT